MHSREEQLLANTVAQPHNTKAHKKYLDYMGKKATQTVQNRLRRFRNMAALGGKEFCHDLWSWMEMPMRCTNIQPTKESAE